MAFTAGKSKEIEGKSNDWLLDQSLMQSMQDRFCDANNVYMVCLNAQNGVVTKAYGTKEELEYVYSKAGRERHVSLLDKMTGHSIESVVEEPLDTDFIKMSGVAIHVSGETIAVWIVIGIMDDSTEDIPDYMMRTSPERYYKSLEFLESLSKQIFAVKMDCLQRMCVSSAQIMKILYLFFETITIYERRKNKNGNDNIMLYRKR